jgi:hypothetical protein
VLLPGLEMLLVHRAANAVLCGNPPLADCNPCECMVAWSQVKAYGPLPRQQRLARKASAYIPLSSPLELTNDSSKDLEHVHWALDNSMRHPHGHTTIHGTLESSMQQALCLTGIPLHHA